VAIIDAMNRIYGVTETRPIWKIRLTAIVMTIIQAFILVSSLLTIVAGHEIVTWIGLSRPAAFLALAVQWVVVVVMVLLSFALSFYVGPDADQSWEWITPGSLLGTIAFLLVSFGFRLYVHNFANYDKTYGSLGGVMVLLFWFWISSLVLLSAAQVNKLIEDASPLGKNVGQKKDPTPAPDFEAMKPEPASP
jgi:membrane protein